MPVIVTPDEFTMVHFDAARITELASHVAGAVGFSPDTEIRIDIDERTPLGRTRLSSLDPITLDIEGGAFEDAKRLRHMSERSVQEVLGRHLFRAKDRLDPAFGDPPPDEQLTLPQTVAWDAYAVGRAVRAGLPGAKPRRLYHFRNRHGFTDVADAVFERLWSGEGLTWSQVEAACAETEAARLAV
jgi:hypothetical protein